MNIHSPCVIFSTFRDSNTTAENTRQFETLMQYFDEHEIDYVELEGKYRGSSERSLLLHGDHLSLALAIARDHKQESILVLDNDRAAELLYVETGERERIGKLRSATEEEALAKLSYSYNPVTKTYYVVE